ncbi:YgaP family membrane protein [Serratia sp. 2723]|uniref:YgaP family membrane protein n=1 Tax=unclassified Serratia (in: enterobacteria) TaxID=2647522 RepID=UPI003D1FA911
MFKKNVPGFERLCRVCVGACIAGLGFAFAPSVVVMWIAIVAGGVLACTGVLGFCPMCAVGGRKLN